MKPVTITLDELAERAFACAQERSPAERVEVDLTELLGEGAVFAYRAPTITDLYAVADPQTLSEWRKEFPDMPDTLAIQLELYARLHLAPASQNPAGRLYAQLVRSLSPARALALLKRIENALASAFHLDQFQERVDEKKDASSRGRKR